MVQSVSLYVRYFSCATGAAAETVETNTLPLPPQPDHASCGPRASGAGVPRPRSEPPTTLT